METIETSLSEYSTTKHIELHHKIIIPMDIPPHCISESRDIINISTTFNQLCGPFNTYYSDDSDSEDTNSEPDIMDLLEYDDYLDVAFSIHDTIKEYLEEHAVEQSSPNFTENMIDRVADHFFYLWEDYGFSMEETSVLELKSWISREITEFLDLGLFVPRQGRGPLHKPSTSDHIREKLLSLSSVEMAEQRSQEWYIQRNNLLTASNIWKVFSTEAQYNSLIVEKCKPVDSGMEMRSGTSGPSSLNWGIMFEPITAEIYCMKNSTKLGEFGCIIHPSYSFLGASPDGINVDPDSPLYGRMIEIKNVVSRQITGIPLESYWIQMQLQMEICDLDECDFIETKFAKISREEYYGEGADNTEIRGIILHVGPRIFIPRWHNYGVDNMDEANAESYATDSTQDNIKKVVYAGGENTTQQPIQPFYVYIPLDISRENAESWIQEYKMSNPNFVVMETIYWKLEQYSCVFIHRNREWFLAALPKIEACWETIEHERVHGFQHRISNKKKTTEVIHTDTMCSVQMPAKSSVCLVKLDHDSGI